jgi:hypothetical protein
MKRRNNKTWRSFEEAREYLHGLGLKGLLQWMAWTSSSERPEDIPKAPWITYRGHGWINLGDWLGTGYLRPRDRTFLPFIEARNFVHSLRLKSYIEWIAFTKSPAFPDNIPAYPRHYYMGKGWKGFLDWLGTRRIVKKRRYRPFKKARFYVRNLGLRNHAEWKTWATSGKRPADIPAVPWVAYKEKGWVSLGDWLGNGNIAYKKLVFRPFEEARTFVRSLGLKSFYEWEAWRKSPNRPTDVPAAPHRKYKDAGWAGWRDWLGTGKSGKAGKK